MTHTQIYKKMEYLIRQFCERAQLIAWKSCSHIKIEDKSVFIPQFQFILSPDNNNKNHRQQQKNKFQFIFRR